MTPLSPIALFVYNRPAHAEQTLNHLLKNSESRRSDLIIFSDGPRTHEDESNVQETRRLIAGITGFGSVRIVERAENYGLAASIISGVTEILQISDRIIVLEDDMVTSPHFLQYMNEALERYSGEEVVGSVHAYMYPIKGLPDFFFVKGGDCWGWGTWRDRWRLMETDGKTLLRRLHNAGMLDEFNQTGGERMVHMLIDQIRGRNSSWSIRWHASLVLNDKLTLQPGHSFVQNIGTDASGTHCSATSVYDTSVERAFNGLPSVDIVQNQEAEGEIRAFMARNRNLPLYRRLLHDVIDRLYARAILLHE